MPFTKLILRAGIDRNRTTTLNEGGWSDGSLVRFRDGQAQKWGGWQAVFTTIFLGIVRAMIAWVQLDGTRNLGAGSSRKYYIGQGGALLDVTPLDLSEGMMGANPLTSGSIGSSIVQVTDISHGRQPGDLQEFIGAATVDGVLVNGPLRIQTVLSPNAYTVIGLGTAVVGNQAGGGTTIWRIAYRDGSFAVNPLSTVLGSAIVTIHHVAHGRSVTDLVELSGLTALNGITLTPGILSTEYAVASVPDPDNYTVVGPQVALATGNGGGPSGAYQYLLTTGVDTALFGNGWGAGLWGTGTWGTPRSGTIQTNSPRIWTHDNWGEDLIAANRDGHLYVWTAATGTSVRLKPIPYAPLICKTVLIGQPERHLITLGSEIGGILDPMLVRWCDVENYRAAGSWTASATNSAGSFRLALGSKIIHGRKTQNGHLVLTDVAAYLMQFINLPFVYGFRPQGSGAGLIGPNAIIDIAGVPYWWGPTGFFRYRGAVEKLPCPYYAELFGTTALSLLQVQAEKVFAGLNSSENEVTWFYPSAGGGGENDRYVSYNFIEDSWSGGALPRTAWIDRDIFSNPQAASPAGKIYQHEIGVDDDGGAMAVYIESGFIDIADGQEIMLIDRMIPDFMGRGGADTPFAGQLTLTLTGRMYPNARSWTKSVTIDATRTYVRLPMRARQIKVRISSSSIGDWWRLGALRVNPRQDGVL